MPSCIRVLSVSVLLWALAGAGEALAITVGASDSGWHSSAGNHTASNQNYAAGWTNEQLRNFFVFDLSSLPIDTVLSATFRAYNPAVCEPDCTFTGGYDSPDATEAYNLREVLAPAAVVTAPTVGNPTVYNDLGDGGLFGTYLASSADNGQFIEIALNASGVAAVQSFVGIGEFVLGGHVSTLTSAFNTEELVFAHTDPPGLGPYTRELIITFVPEPGTGALMALGLVAIGSARRRASTGRIG